MTRNVCGNGRRREGGWNWRELLRAPVGERAARKALQPMPPRLHAKSPPPVCADRTRVRREKHAARVPSCVRIDRGEGPTVDGATKRAHSGRADQSQIAASNRKDLTWRRRCKKPHQSAMAITTANAEASIASATDISVLIET